MAEFTRNVKEENRLSIVPLEPCKNGKKNAVKAHFNPKEIQVDKNIPWQKHPDSKADEPYLEFTGAEGRTLSMELLFDAYEANGTIDGPLGDLTEMAKVKQDSGPENERRPPKLQVNNGPWEGSFTCVLESLSIKITMFNTSNKPVRATVNVKFREAKRLDLAKSAGRSGAPSSGGR